MANAANPKEYRVETVSALPELARKAIEALINEVAANGWELAALSHDSGNAPGRVIMAIVVFQRDWLPNRPKDQLLDPNRK